MDFNASPAALQQHPRPAPRSAPALERKIPLRRPRFRQRFSSKHSTTARELRRGARGRCPRRGEEQEALRLRQGRRQTSTVEHSPMATTERSVFRCAAMFHQQEGSPSARPCWPRLRQHLSPDLEERRTSRA